MNAVHCPALLLPAPCCSLHTPTFNSLATAATGIGPGFCSLSLTSADVFPLSKFALAIMLLLALLHDGMPPALGPPSGPTQEVARLLPPASLRSLSATCRRLQRIADHLVNSLDLPLSLLSEPGFSKAGGAALARALARRFRGTSDMQVNLYFNSALHPHECQEAFRVLGQHLPVQRLWLHDACTW